jgi:hypothetical protein
MDKEIVYIYKMEYFKKRKKSCCFVKMNKSEVIILSETHQRKTDATCCYLSFDCKNVKLREA